MKKSAKKNQAKCKPQAKGKKKYIYRSSITGRIVGKDFAKANPDTTTRESA